MKDLGSLDLELGGDRETVDLDALLPIDESDLSTEFRDQASKYAYVATLAALAESEAQDAKRTMEREEAEADKRARKHLKRTEDKVTEGAIKAEVVLDEGYQEAQDKEAEARTQALLMKAVERSMSMRAEMLVSLGAHLRHEFEATGMTILEAKDKLEALRRKR